MKRKILSLLTAATIIATSINPVLAFSNGIKNSDLEKSALQNFSTNENVYTNDKIVLPIVTEEMPKDEVKEKYFKIIFSPQKSYKYETNLKNYGKLINKNGKELELIEDSTQVPFGTIKFRGKIFYALKSADWSEILAYKLGDGTSLFDLSVDNNESDPEKREIHKFKCWAVNGFNVDFKNPKTIEKKAKKNKCDIDKAIVFYSVFYNNPYIYSTDSAPYIDSDNYRTDLKDFYKIRFLYSKANQVSGYGKLFLSDWQKKYAIEEINGLSKMNLILRKDFKDEKLSKLQPLIEEDENHKFWYWYEIGNFNHKLDQDSPLPTRDEIINIAGRFLYDGMLLESGEGSENKPLLEGFYKISFETEDGFEFSNFKNGYNAKYKNFAIKSGSNLSEIKNLPEKPVLHDKNWKDYSDSVYWFQDGKKIEDIKSIKVDSDKIFVARFEREADKFIPETKEIEVNLNENVTVEKLKEGISNLREDIKKLEIKEKADTSKIGKNKAVLILTFSDTSNKEVEIPVKVVEKIEGSIISPIPKIEEKDILKEEVPYNGKINLLDNIKNLPKDTKIEDITNSEIDTKIPGTYIGKVKVTFKNSSSRIIEIPIAVFKSLADEYIPKVNNIEITQGQDVDSDLIKNYIGNEDNKIVEVLIKNGINTLEIGEHRVNLDLIFKDESRKELEFVIKVKEKEEAKTSLAKMYPIIKPSKTKIEDTSSLSEAEKNEIIEKISSLNPKAKLVSVEDMKNVILTYEDGSENIISLIELVEEIDKKEEEDKNENEKENKDDELKVVEDKNIEKLDYWWNNFPRHTYRREKGPIYFVERGREFENKGNELKKKKYLIDTKNSEYKVIEDEKTKSNIMSTKVFIKNDRTFIPARSIAEILGAKVIWNENTRTASFTRENLTAILQIDNNKIILSNGKIFFMEEKALNIDGRIYLPLTNIAEVFGMSCGNLNDGEKQDIEWDDENKIITMEV